MGAEVSIDPRPLRDVFESTGQASVTNDGVFVRLLAMTVRTGMRPRLTLLGANVDPGAEAYCSFRVLVNGSPLTDRLYGLFTSAPAVVYDPGARVIVPIELAQGAFVEVQGAIAAGAGAAKNMYVRLRIEYVDIE